MDTPADPIGAEEDGPPDRLTIHFPKPLKFSGQELTSIELREPLVGEVVKAMSKGTALEQLHALIAAVSGAPAGALTAMPASAFRAAERFLLHYLQANAPEEHGPAEEHEDLVLQFAEPICVGSVQRERLLVSEPTLSMLTLAAKAGSQLAQDVKLLALASMASGGSEDLVGQMRFSDFARGRDFLEGFTAASARTS